MAAPTGRSPLDQDDWPPAMVEPNPEGAALRLSQPFLPGLLRLQAGAGRAPEGAGKA